jgi:hypothetical protein
MNFNEDLLGNVVSIIVIDDHFTHMPVHPLLVSANKQIKSVIPGLRIFDLKKEVFVFQRF